MHWVIVCVVMLTGCASVEQLGATLNERQVTSCLWYGGSYGPFVQIRGVTATGGASLDTCLRRE